MRKEILYKEKIIGALMLVGKIILLIKWKYLLRGFCPFKIPVIKSYCIKIEDTFGQIIDLCMLWLLLLRINVFKMA